MEALHFDALTRRLTLRLSRRHSLGFLASLSLPGRVAPSAAKKKKRKRKKKKCAKAGQATSKKRKKCCKGLVKDGAGRCADCDVCASGCRYDTVQAAVDDPSGPSTIAICAGTYREHLTIGRGVTLVGTGDGNGAGDTILDGTSIPGGPEGSVVTIPAGCPGCTVTLERLRITGGFSDSGGGINNLGGVVTLRQCTVSGNRSADIGIGGGGIHNVGGRLTLDASHVTSNDTAFESGVKCGGGIKNENDGPSPGEVTLQNGSTVTGNGSFSIDGGGICNLFNGTVTLFSGSLVSGNTGQFGGGIINSGALTLIDSEVSGNTALAQGGGISNHGVATLLEGSTVTDNTAMLSPPSGGGIYTTGALAASGGSITDNTPDQCVQESGGTGCPP